MIIYGMNPVLDSIDLYFDKIKKYIYQKKLLINLIIIN